MAMNDESTDFARQRLLWLRIGRVLCVAALFFALLMLGESMVHHRFFRGGRIDQHGVLRP